MVCSSVMYSKISLNFIAWSCFRFWARRLVYIFAWLYLRHLASLALFMCISWWKRLRTKLSTPYPPIISMKRRMIPTNAEHFQSTSFISYFNEIINKLQFNKSLLCFIYQTFFVSRTEVQQNSLWMISFEHKKRGKNESVSINLCTHRCKQIPSKWILVDSKRFTAKKGTFKSKVRAVCWKIVLFKVNTCVVYTV